MPSWNGRNPASGSSGPTIGERSTGIPPAAEITPRRLTGSGDLWVAEASLDYGDGIPYQTVFIFELRDDRIAKETAYWSQAFPAPDWRSEWVEAM